MTELATQELARARAARIRAGIATYLHTLADVSAAYQQRDWTALGYADWQAYVDGEFSEAKLRLSPEHRAKAVAELRLAGMSQRAIGTALGVDQTTVLRDLRRGDADASPAEIQGADGKTYAASRPQSPATSPEPGPEASTSTGPGHDHPLATGEADARLDAAVDAAASEAPTGIRPSAGAGDPLPAHIAEQIEQRIQARSAPDPLDDPEAIEAAHRQRTSESVAAALVSLFLALDPDPVRWLEHWQPDAYRNRDLPRVRDVFTTTGLRTVAKHIDAIADHLDRTGGTL